MKRYELGSIAQVPDDYEGEQFYTVGDAIENGDWDFIREVARLGDLDAIEALKVADAD